MIATLRIDEFRVSMQGWMNVTRATADSNLQDG